MFRTQNTGNNLCSSNKEGTDDYRTYFLGAMENWGLITFRENCLLGKSTGQHEIHQDRNFLEFCDTNETFYPYENLVWFSKNLWGIIWCTVTVWFYPQWDRLRRRVRNSRRWLQLWLMKSATNGIRFGDLLTMCGRLIDCQCLLRFWATTQQMI
jgi:hypothetical protein